MMVQVCDGVLQENAVPQRSSDKVIGSFPSIDRVISSFNDRHGRVHGRFEGWDEMKHDSDYAGL
jgi:hypothetical protein